MLIFDYWKGISRHKQEVKYGEWEMKIREGRIFLYQKRRLKDTKPKRKKLNVPEQLTGFFFSIII